MIVGGESKREERAVHIVDVRTTLLRYPYERPIASGGGLIHARPALLVEVTTDAGVTGVGESAAGSRSLIDEELRPLLLGQDPLRIEWLWQSIYRRLARAGRHGVVLNALSGVDVALWDILGKVAGLPVSRLLGAYQDRLPAYASAGFYQEGKGIPELQAEAATAARDGFRAFKMKVGRARRLVPGPLAHGAGADRFVVEDDAADVARVAAVREALGPGPELMIDANCAWTPEQALRFARAVEPYRIFWIEEPVDSGDVAASAALAAATPIPIAGYESEVGLEAFARYVATGAVDVVQPDVAWAGGISECRRIAALAQAHHLAFAPHCFSSAVLLAASLHLAASLPNCSLIEIDRNPNPLRDRLLREPLVVRDGYVDVPAGPGLGIELDPDAIERYRVG
jgi:L-alanine-DL-glutamate epimerase-like enolase superfamily enzyme